MFWRFNYLSSEIDTLLDKEDVTLTEIISEEDVLQECKAQNAKLVDYLTRPENMKDLVNMVVTEPSTEIEEKIRYKFPNISCELVTSDVNAITDALVNAQPLLDTLLGFLDNEQPLNPLQASFFSKVIGLLITRKSQAILDYLKSRENFLGRVLHHLETSAIMDLLLRLVMSMETQQCKIECLEWLKEQKLIERLVNVIRPSNKPEAHYNAALSLCDLIRHGRDQMSFEQECNTGEILLNVIQSEESIATLLNNMFEDPCIESSLLSGLSVLQTLLEFRRISSEGPFESMSSVLPDIDKFMTGVKGALKAITPKLKDFHAILTQPPKQHYCPMLTTVGVLDLPFGNSRLQVARLFNCLLVLNYNPINNELHRLGSLGMLLDLFFDYSWNNFLHKQLELGISVIMTNSTATESSSKNHSQLISQMLVEFKLLERIMDTFDTNEDQIKSGGRRLGYMGHLMKIADSLSAHKLEELVQDLPQCTMERWSQFISTTLVEVNKMNSVDGVGGSTPVSLAVTDDDFRLDFQSDESERKFGYIGDELLENEDIGVAINDSYNWSSLSPTNLENSEKKASIFEDMCEARNNLADEEVWEEKLANFPESLLKPDLLEKIKASEIKKEGDKHNVSPTVEDMDVSTNEGWAKFPDLPMEEGTVPSSWSASPSTQANADNLDNWADFSRLEAGQRNSRSRSNHTENLSEAKGEENDLITMTFREMSKKCESPEESSSQSANTTNSNAGEIQGGAGLVSDSIP